MNLAYDPFSHEWQQDPYPIYRRMRAEKPAYYVEEYDAWFLSRFEDIWKSGANFKNLSAADGTTPGHLLTHLIESVVFIVDQDDFEFRERYLKV